jgi:hypothetical protein
VIEFMPPRKYVKNPEEFDKTTTAPEFIISSGAAVSLRIQDHRWSWMAKR